MINNQKAIQNIDNQEMIKNIDTNILFNLVNDGTICKETFNDMYINILIKVYHMGLYQGMYRRDEIEQMRVQEKLRFRQLDEIEMIRNIQLDKDVINDKS